MSRKQQSRETADWCRANGIVPSGHAWAAASVGVRDVLLLARLNMADGYAVKGKTQDGSRYPAGLREGDHLPEYGGTLVAAPIPDPSTGLYLVTLRIATRPTDDYSTGVEYADVELHPAEPVAVAKKPRRLAPHVEEALAEYRLAYAAWEDRRDAWTQGYAAEAKAYADHMLREGHPDPAPRLPDFIREVCARRREPEPQEAAA